MILPVGHFVSFQTDNRLYILNNNGFEYFQTRLAAEKTLNASLISLGHAAFKRHKKLNCKSSILIIPKKY